MVYKIVITEKADAQIHELIMYIAEDSGSRQIAQKYLDKLEKAINRLEMFPDSGSIPRYPTLKKQGYRIVIVEKHLIFYKVDLKNKIVTIYAVVDSRREYLYMIK